MVSLVKGSALEKEIANCAENLERSGAAARSSGNLIPLLEPKMSDSLDETVHQFLKSARTKTSDAVIRELGRPDNLTGSRLSNTYSMVVTTERPRGRPHIVPIILHYRRPELEKDARKLTRLAHDDKAAEFSSQNLSQATAHVVTDWGEFLKNGQDSLELAQKMLEYQHAPPGLLHYIARSLQSPESAAMSAALPAVILFQILKDGLKAHVSRDIGRILI